MKRLTLKFQSLADVATFTKSLQSGYIVNTVLCTVTGLFTQEEFELINKHFPVTLVGSGDAVPASPSNSFGAYSTRH